MVCQMKFACKKTKFESFEVSELIEPHYGDTLQKETLLEQESTFHCNFFFFFVYNHNVTLYNVNLTIIRSLEIPDHTSIYG